MTRPQHKTLITWSTIATAVTLAAIFAIFNFGKVAFIAKADDHIRAVADSTEGHSQLSKQVARGDSVSLQIMKTLVRMDTVLMRVRIAQEVTMTNDEKVRVTNIINSMR
jgi:predicted DNA repair protein MutK